METNIALAFLIRGNYVESAKYYDRALEKLGVSKAISGFTQAHGMASIMLGLIKHIYFIYFPTKKKMAPTDSDNRYARYINNRNLAKAVFDGKGYLFDVVREVGYFRKFDLSKSQVFFDHYCSNIMLFSAGGVSLKIGRKVLNDALGAIESGERRFNLGGFHMFRMAEMSVSGNWHNEFNEEIINLSLKVGDTYSAAAYQLHAGHMHIGLGNFDTVERSLKCLLDIAISYNDEHARCDFYEIRGILLLCKKDPEKALDDINANILLMEKLGQDTRKVTFLGMKIQAETLQNRLRDAEKSLEQTKNLVKKVSKISLIPFMYSHYAMGGLLLHIAKLEKAIDQNDKKTIPLNRKQALKGAKDALKTAKKYAPIITKACRLKGKIHWLSNNQKQAFKWYRRSIKKGERLGARPELSRTYFEVGKRLLEPQAKYQLLNGISAEEYLENARVMFKDMNLQWDLEQLEKATNDDQIHITLTEKPNGDSLR